MIYFSKTSIFFIFLWQNQLILKSMKFPLIIFLFLFLIIPSLFLLLFLIGTSITRIDILIFDIKHVAIVYFLKIHSIFT